MKYYLLLFMAILIPEFSDAHQLSTGYLSLKTEDQNRFSGELQLQVLDMDKTLSLDVDGNGEIAWREILLQTDSIIAWLEKNFMIKNYQDVCDTRFSPIFQLDEHYNHPYIVIHLSSVCENLDQATLSYRGFSVFGSDHKLLVSTEGENSNIKVMDSQSVQLSLSKNSSQQ